MKKAVIRISFSDGSIGYYKSPDCITSDRNQAKVFNKIYAEGLVEGLNFAINFYEDLLAKDAKIEEL